MKSREQTEDQPQPGRAAPDDFCAWWYPTGTDELTGASVGGHPDAIRVWARPMKAGFLHKTMGTNANVAWFVQEYRDQFLEWKSIGSPEPSKPFVSEALPLVEGAKRFAEVVAAAMPKKMLAAPVRPALPVPVIDVESDPGPIEF